MTQLQDRVAEIVRNDPNVQALSSAVGGGGGGGTNTGRMFINLKARGEREAMPQVLEGLRRKLRAVPGIQVYLRPVQNLQLGGRQSKSRYQYTLQSVSAGELGTWATRLLRLAVFLPSNAAQISSTCAGVGKPASTSRTSRIWSSPSEGHLRQPRCGAAVRRCGEI